MRPTFRLCLTFSLALTLTLAACQPAVPEAMPPQPTEAMLDKPTAEAMLDKPTAEAMLAKPTAEALADHTPAAMRENTPEAMGAATPAAMMETPAWFGAALTDVATGASFTLNDFHGQVVLVETLAVWCPKCLQQQQQVKALHAALGERADFVSLGLGIDPHESAEILRDYAAAQGFDWRFAVAPAEVVRELAALYGNQFLNPPSTPMLIIDRQGAAHPLPFGIKSAEALQAALEPFLASGQ